jgi:AGZA family xanthine/uracil permease-like MFS transporter
MLDRWFHLSERGTTVRIEAIAGLTTFMTMAYIIFANPSILSQMPDLGTPEAKAALTAATCLAAAVPTLVMGLYANYPFALASGMGLNALLVTVVVSRGLPWQVGMGIIVAEGIVITVLVVAGLREVVMDAIPLALKQAISVGIGLLIALLGLKQAQIIGVVQTGGGDWVLVPGDVATPEVLLAAFGLIVTAVLMTGRVRGAILLGIVATAIVGAAAGKVKAPTQVVGVPNLELFGQADLVGALDVALIGTIFAFLITDFFDTMGTVIGVGGEGGFLDGQGRLPRLRRVLLVDSLAAAWGGLCGASSATTYIESAAGVAVGGRTGLTSVVVGVLFVLAAFFAPLAGVVPSFATAPALVVVGLLLMAVVREIDFKQVGDALPAFLVIIIIPLTMSISHGIGYGFIMYTVIRVLTGRYREVHPLMYAVSILFAAAFALG